jgi:carbon storage regulator CsrA
LSVVINDTVFLGKGNSVLVLTRGKGEVVHIGDEIVVTVLKHRNGRTILGISAPDDCKILRGELYNASLGGCQSSNTGRDRG